MNKQEIINNLAELLKQSNPNLKGKDTVTNTAYNDAIIDAMDVIRAYEINYALYQPTASGTEDSIKHTIKLIRECFQVKLSDFEELRIATSIDDKCYLQAVKQYKDATGMGLKECKKDVDNTRVKLGTMTVDEYKSIWQIKT